MDRLYLGVDGGQSSTTALIADDAGLILGRGVGGPCNHVKAEDARAKFSEALGDCLGQACAQANISPGQVEFAAACLGFSGGADDKEQYAREAVRSKQWKITHDAEIALTGATAGEPGIMVIAGTGSMAFGRNAAGETARAGGWGYLFGDEGGALYLVREALRTCLRHEEGWGEPTLLKALFLEATGAVDINELLHRFYVEPRSEVAAYAYLLNEAAEARDKAALRIFDDAGDRLAWYVAGVHQHIFGGEADFQVSYAGGAFRSSYLLRAYCSRIRQYLQIEAVSPAMSPVEGAVLEALRLTRSRSKVHHASRQGSTPEVK